MRVQCTPGTLATLTPGAPAQVATSLVVREDSLTLYGFGSDDERNVFELLQTASGVGPRLALAMLAVHTPDALRRAVATEDLGALTMVVLAAIAHPSRLRLTSTVHHLEKVGLNAVPIIVLSTLLIGAILAQQGIFQLQRFGATPYAVNLIGILVLRELGVLLTSIMIAGRSGSAITAEIGSMKMNQEIDAMQVLGVDAFDALVFPRFFALLMTIPLLVFCATIAGLLGGLIPVGKMSVRKSTSSSVIPSGTFMGATSAIGTRTYSAWPPA